jgi:DNA-binding transcriptional ArsR family regulator
MRRHAAAFAPVFAALGDETRLRLLEQLCAQGPQSISRLTEASSVSRQAVTKHLEALADAGLVQSERAGRERIWRLEPAQLAAARRRLDAISERWDQAITRLRSMVEDDPS